MSCMKIVSDLQLRGIRGRSWGGQYCGDKDGKHGDHRVRVSRNSKKGEKRDERRGESVV